MPVVSPHRSSSSGLAGSYRSTYSSSLDKPYYGTSSYTPSRFSYSERYTTRSYTDTDGRRIFSRTGSITEDGVTTRFREESREGSVRRDTYTSRDSSIREGSVLDGGGGGGSRRDGSLTRNDSSRLSAINVAESVADIRNKYSPANYVPTVLRNRAAASDSNNISRSKTLNDIGLPPIETKGVAPKRKVTETNVNTTASGVVVRELFNNTNFETDNMHNQDDDNGNRPSVSEMRKRFDKSVKRTQTDAPKPTRLKKVEEKPKAETVAKRKVFNAKVVNGRKTDNCGDGLTGDRKSGRSSTDGAELRGGKLEDSVPSKKAVSNGKCSNHVNNFASYIPSKDFEKDTNKDSSDNNGDMENINSIGKTKKISKDIATSPNRLNRSSLAQNASSSTAPGNSNISAPTSQRNSVEKDYGKSTSYSEEDRRFDRSSPTKQMGLNGLKNIGNTCFMNSVIQCLSNTKPLLEYVKKDGYTSDINTTASSMKGALIKAFAQVIKELWSEDTSDRVVNTVSLKSQIQRFAPRFMGYSQQDAQEFLRYLLEGLHEDVNRVAEKPKPIHTEIDEKLSDGEKATESWQRYLRRENSKIVDLFVGQLKSTLRCTHCGHCSVTFDPFWDLSLPIPQKTGPVRLSQCLESFTREETLDGDEKPTCSKCKERRKCTKSFSIHKFPKILVIHLKRFSPTERFRGKLSVTVEAPLEGLDMSNYSAEGHAPCRYNLYAISNHSGTTYSGHYTAYCRHPYSGSWHEYNDSRVSSISSRSVVSGEAYVLFYELDNKLSHL